MKTDLGKLESYTCTKVSLAEVSVFLKHLKTLGITRSEVVNFLKNLRSKNITEEDDDRILEIADIVTGFCNERYRVW